MWGWLGGGVVLSGSGRHTGARCVWNAFLAPRGLFKPGVDGCGWIDRKSGVWGKSVDLGGRGIMKKKKRQEERGEGGCG